MIGVLLAMLVIVVPSVYFVKKVKATRTEMLRVKNLLDDWEVRNLSHK